MVELAVVEGTSEEEDEVVCSSSGFSLAVLLFAPVVLGAEDAEVLVVVVPVGEPEEEEAEAKVVVEKEEQE